MRTTPLLIPLLLAGCYTYADTAPAAVPVGTAVRVALSDSGSLQLAPLVGPRAAALEGRFAARTDTAFTVAVRQLTRFDGSDEGLRGERVRIPAAATTGLQRRSLSRGRTAGLTAGVVAVAALAIRAFQGSEDVTRGTGRGPGGGAGQ